MVDAVTAWKPALADWLEEAMPDALTIYDWPEKHRSHIRTPNMLNGTTAN